MEKEATCRSAIPKVILTYWEELMENLEVDGNLGKNHHEMREFTLLRRRKKGYQGSRIRIMDLRKAMLSRLRELVGRVSQGDKLDL